MSHATTPAPEPSSRELASNDDGPPAPDAVAPGPNTTGPRQSPEQASAQPNTTGPRQREE